MVTKGHSYSCIQVRKFEGLTPEVESGTERGGTVTDNAPATQVRKKTWGNRLVVSDLVHVTQSLCVCPESKPTYIQSTMQLSVINSHWRVQFAPVSAILHLSCLSLDNEHPSRTALGLLALLAQPLPIPPPHQCRSGK